MSASSPSGDDELLRGDMVKWVIFIYNCFFLSYNHSCHNREGVGGKRGGGRGGGRVSRDRGREADGRS